MQKTKIDWCDMTWNPVTGCLHGCQYCYAADYCHRFGGSPDVLLPSARAEMTPMIHDLEEKQWYWGYERKAPFPYYFEPTLHRYRLNDPQRKKKPQNIFVCSMADLFGAWIPDEWIKAVFDACKEAPQHRYLFLTKNGGRYSELYQAGLLPDSDNMWFGSTITTDEDEYWFSMNHNGFLSVEPILKGFQENYYPEALVKWIIIGAETGNRKEKVIPQRDWIENIVKHCKEYEIPLFMKNSLAKIWGEPLIQEFPW